jgi:hypothetical protein
MRSVRRGDRQKMTNDELITNDPHGRAVACAPLPQGEEAARAAGEGKRVDSVIPSPSTSLRTGSVEESLIVSLKGITLRDVSTSLDMTRLRRVKPLNR